MFESLDQAIHSAKKELDSLAKQHATLSMDVPKLEGQRSLLADEIRALLVEKQSLQEAIDQGNRIQEMIDDLKQQREELDKREAKNLELAESVNKTAEATKKERQALERDRQAIRDEKAEAQASRVEADKLLTQVRERESKAAEIVAQLTFRAKKLTNAEEGAKTREKAVIAHSGRLKLKEAELDRREKQLADREQTLKANLTL